MQDLCQQFAVRYTYRVRFTRQAFRPENSVLAETIGSAPADGVGPSPARVMVVLDGGLVEADPSLPGRASAYLGAHADRLRPAAAPLVLPGGEGAKRGSDVLVGLLTAMERAGLCRHSFLVAVGGGALLDVAGFAAAIAHRGVRLVRMPSTVLAQNDAGIGVKNGVNAFGHKNYLGCFAPPWAVVNDLDLLRTLSLRDQRAGLAEAVKVALIRDAGFLQQLEREADALRRGEAGPLERAVHHCAALHLGHIAASGDPFEQGSAGWISATGPHTGWRSRPPAVCATGKPWPSAWPWIAAMPAGRAC